MAASKRAAASFKGGVLTADTLTLFLGAHTFFLRAHTLLATQRGWETAHPTPKCMWHWCPHMHAFPSTPAVVFSLVLGLCSSITCLGVRPLFLASAPLCSSVLLTSPGCPAQTHRAYNLWVFFSLHSFFLSMPETMPDDARSRADDMKHVKRQ